MICIYIYLDGFDLLLMTNERSYVAYTDSHVLYIPCTHNIIKLVLEVFMHCILLYLGILCSMYVCRDYLEQRNKLPTSRL